jgi:hypothetical protein
MSAIIEIRENFGEATKCAVFEVKKKDRHSPNQLTKHPTRAKAVPPRASE